MKNIVTLLLIFVQSTFLFSQSIEPAPTDKAVVYFTRASSLGGLINFTYFDGENAIGRFNGPKYMRYECEPGEHLFWARSENKAYVEADLEAGNIYIIDVIPIMGAIKSSLRLVPVDKANYKMKKIQKLLSKRVSELFSESELNKLQNEMGEVIARGMERYHQLKETGDKIVLLKPEMTVDEKDLVYVK